MDAENEVLGQDGQALVEFLLFLPFMLMMYSIIITIGNSINASINQQKVTRSYLFYRIQNNSTIPIRNYVQGHWSSFGNYHIGWMDRLDGRLPVAPCLKLRVPLSVSEGDNCDNSYQGLSTQFIRIGTVYGICGTTYSRGNDGVVMLPGNHPNRTLPYISQGCTIQ